MIIGNFYFKYVGTKDIVADGIIKGLNKEKYKGFVK